MPICVSVSYRHFILLAAVLACILHTGPAHSRELPLTMEPRRLAESLDEPERSIRLALAESLHDSQEAMLEQARHDAADRRSKYLSAIALALEEYYQLELSYPPNVSHAKDACCLLEEWEGLGYYLVDYDDIQEANSANCLMYLPQPLGLTSLKSVPGEGCGVSRRCFDEYSVAVPQIYMEDWKIDQTRLTWWMTPFVDQGLAELMNVNQANPGASKCAAC